MNQLECNEAARILKAIGHPGRLEIVLIVMNSTDCNQVCLINEMNMPQSTIALHLHRLVSENIIHCENFEHKMYYSIKEVKVIKLLAELLKCDIIRR